MSDALRPGVTAGGYPERLEPRPSPLARAVSRARARLRGERPTVAGLRAHAHDVIARSEALASVTEAELALRVAALRPALRREFAGEPLVEAQAIVREYARRVLGMAHFDVQLMAGAAMLHGMLVELDTGEGKTLSATLPAAVAGLAGIPVHVITANDYLVERDAGQMGPLYRALGLAVGAVLGTEPDARARRSAYACDVTYVSNKQVAFDYLRDRLARPHRNQRLRSEVSRLAQAGTGESLMLRGLCFAIVDEADSVLVDEARTPLILSRNVPSPDLEAAARCAMRVAGALSEGADYRLAADGRDAAITAAGRARIGELTSGEGGVFRAPRRREDLVRVALTALAGYTRDEDYIVRDGRVEIVDRYTGRSMPDRSFEGGLQQMIELKEGCAPSGQRETIARISYQQFFRRYLRLAGMTGTAREVAAEVADVYDLPVVRVDPRLPPRRVDLGVRVLPDRHAKWRAVVERLRALHAAGRPVLVGTRSVHSSETLGRALEAAGLDHVVLNARQDRNEAEVVRAAGEPTRITVATTMAGRGTDIRVPEQVEQRGGLHVLTVERAEARRIDRQLVGRCGRQGDAGSFEELLSIEDALPAAELRPAFVVALLKRLLARDAPGAERLARSLIAWGQRRIERRHAAERALVLRREAELERTLAFAGVGE